ncbi:hypothetical protein ACGLDV_004283 [Escherichia coli]|uniref:hypothetical protein n=1 Tax=Escherichia coli TaxID=562 RepID=UPI00025CAF29|nr:hypothetical protein [Escherichia coli]EEW5316478.1 hypothetical protein [Escherichia coli]EFB1611238.1 hypothetical protein [Escherichia coli]EFB5296002.1 hypothetical protein [Escherichia coli]EFB6924122.1 hypothetical protein [Escherichia coli]EFF0473974.1 hypothetical protein [Escherichia coli]
MSEKNEFAEGKVICNEIGSAVLEVLGHKRELAVQSLIDVLQEAQQDVYARVKGMKLAIKILQKFV